MKKAIGLIFVFWIGLSALPGCLPCRCPKDVYADVAGATASVVGRDTMTSGLKRVDAGSFAHWRTIAFFSVNYTIRTYSQVLPAAWGTVAYACDCVEPGSLGSNEQLTNLTVKTVFDFDATHPAGSSLTELAVLTGGYRADNYKKVSLSVADFLAGGTVRYEDARQFSKLSLPSPPTVRGPFALDITVTLNNGEVYTARTTPVQLI